MVNNQPGSGFSDMMALLMDSPDIVAVVDLESGACTSANRAFLNTFGYEPDELVGRTLADLSIWADEIQGNRLGNLLRKNGHLSQIVLPLKIRGGEVRSFQMSASISSLHGRDQVIAVLHDVTERLQTEILFEKNQILLERAEEMANIGSWEFDYSTGVVTGSPGAHRIYGADNGAFSVNMIESVPLPEYRSSLNRAREDLIHKGEPYDIEFKIRRLSDGKILDIHSRAEWDPEKKKLFGIIRDITEEKAAREVLEALNIDLERRVGETSAYLEEARKAQSRAETVARLSSVVAQLSHELNTPLGTALTATSYLADEFQTGGISGSTIEAVNLIRQSVNKAIELVSGFRKLDVSTSVDKQMPGMLELPSFLELLTHTLLPESDGKSRIIVDYKGTPSTVIVDVIALTEVITEFVKNAFFHNPDSIEIVISPKFSGGQMEIQVRDNGIGIDESVRDNLFEPFVTTARSMGRPGLGLSVVHGLVQDRLGGSVRLINAAGQGAVFQVRFKITRV